MAAEKIETVIAGNYLEMEREEASNISNSDNKSSAKTKLSNFFWHGGSVYDAWFSCASNQVAQVLLTLPYSFSQLGMMSGILFQLFYGLMGSWTAYLISVLYVEYRTRKEREKFDFRNHVIQWFEVLDGLLGKHWRNIGLIFNCTFLLFGSVIQLIACASNIYYINDKLDKRTWTYIFGACCATTVFIPSFHNYRIWSFLGLAMTTYTSWYLTIASLLHGQAEDVKHSGPTTMVLYFTGATNILYTFGGHAVTVEIMHAMWKPQKFKAIYLLATIYVLTLTLPSASAVYWAFGDQLLTHSNALSLLPKSGFRDTAVILMLIHQFITFGFASTPLYFVWEKLIGVHESKSMFKRAMARLPVVLPIWFLAIIFPFFGPINSAVGSLLVSFTVYIIPALAHMLTFAPAPSREVTHWSETHPFPAWVKDIVQGPVNKAKTWPIYFTRGFLFHTQTHGEGRKTCNYGVCTKGESYTNAADESQYYGILTNIIQIEYEGIVDLKITLFKCKWYDPIIGRGTRRRNGGIVDVLSSRKYYKYDPFILASQADQVCYISYPYVRKPRQSWLNVLKVNPRRIIFGEYEDNDPVTLQQENDDAVLMTTVEDLEVEHLVHASGEPINIDFDVADAEPNDEFRCNLSSSDDEDGDDDESY